MIMGYIVDIKNKLDSMKNRDLHVEFYQLADILIEHQPEALDILLKVINIYDQVARKEYGQRRTIENLKRKQEMSAWSADARKGQL